MNPRERPWYVGAYALTASLSMFNEKLAQSFYEELSNLPYIAGLELPVHRLEKHDDPWRHLRLLPRHLDYILTPLPFVMQTLDIQPQFGLASADAEGRRAALQAVLDLKDRIKRLEDHCGRAAVRAIELHSAPSRTANARSLHLSLESLARENWGGVEIWLEHCDAMRPGQVPAKGFLDIDAEIAALRTYGLGMNINWGRSVLETRSVSGPIAHLQKAADNGVLRALFFSSTSVHDPIYGSWLDNHAPMQWNDLTPWMPRSSFLTVETARTALRAGLSAQILGIKVQPAPASLPLDARLQCLRRHLERLHELESTVLEGV